MRAAARGMRRAALIWQSCTCRSWRKSGTATGRTRPARATAAARQATRRGAVATARAHCTTCRARRRTHFGMWGSASRTALADMLRARSGFAWQPTGDSLPISRCRPRRPRGERHDTRMERHAMH
eukprot:828225-Prymnesium_polylepis.1